MKIDERMKEYEYVTRYHLTKRVPVIIRLDGRAFHTFCRGFEKPFDKIMVKTMQDTMKELCENIQGCVLGYTQSDEITLVLIDYQNKDSQPWFDYTLQKILSLSGSMATLYFNKNFRLNDEFGKYFTKYDIALFDSRAFNIPKEDVANCLIWRQQDAIKNSILSLAQANFSHKELNGIDTKQAKGMLFDKGQPWESLPLELQRGSCCIKQPIELDTIHGIITRYKWVIDKEIPIFVDNKEYIEQLIV